ncbi:DUF4388 domain-containing protein [bacterium]|nr:DUF4388 domain-containing protein [bacterium]
MLEGSLAKTSLGTVFQHIVHQTLTGRLTVRSDGRELLYFFVRGKLQNATKNPDATGSRHLFNLIKGDFLFDEAQDIDSPISPELTTFRWLLDRSLETADPRAMQWVLLSPHAIPQVLSIPIAELTDDEMKVAALIDDDRTITDIVKASPLLERFTLQVLFGLVIADTIRLVRTFEVVRVLVHVLDEFVLALGKTRLTANGAERMFGKAISDAIVDNPQLEYLELSGSSESLHQLRCQFERGADALKILGDLLEYYYKAVSVFIDNAELAKILNGITSTCFVKHLNLVNELRINEFIQHIIADAEPREREQLWSLIVADEGSWNILG